MTTRRPQSFRRARNSLGQTVLNRSRGISQFALGSAYAESITPAPVTPLVFQSVGVAGMPPFNSLDSAGNVKLNAASLLGAQRFVARKTGTLSRVWWKVRCDTGAGASYVGGTLGTARVRLCPCDAAGKPNLVGVLATIGPMAPTNAALYTGDSNKSWHMDFNIAVVAGQMYAIVVDNTDGTPATNYFSAPNNHYLSNGAFGAATRNELAPTAPDVFDGLYPQEVNMSSTDGGTNWNIPGAAGSAGGISKYCPTMIQIYSDGSMYAIGEYYTGTTGYTTGTFNMNYKNKSGAAWIFNTLGFYLTAAQTGTYQVQILVDGVTVQTVTVTNPYAGHTRILLSAPISVPPNSTVTFQFPADGTGVSGLGLKQQYSDSDFDTVLGHGVNYKWWCSELASRAFPIWPLPYFDTTGLVL